MQLAYAPSMSKEKYTGPRVQRRLHWLKMLVAEGGGPTSVGAAVGTPPSHISAMTAGRRGVGDALADSLESAFGRPNGWMDRPIPETDAPLADTPSQVSRPTLAQALEVVAAALSSVPVEKRQALLGVLATYASDPVQESNSLSYLQSELAKTQARAGVHPSSIATGQPPGGKV